jgi:hypothetical protein
MRFYTQCYEVVNGCYLAPLLVLSCLLLILSQQREMRLNRKEERMEESN